MPSIVTKLYTTYPKDQKFLQWLNYKADEHEITNIKFTAFYYSYVVMLNIIILKMNFYA